MVCILAKKQLANEGAFSLVELSVVITIMGLLVAATMAGSTLLATGKLRSVIGEIESYKIAVDNFQMQYEALPGDMKNADGEAPATGFWTRAQNGGVLVQNGNGDGRIGNGDDKTEPYYAWNHLTLSKFVPGTFTGSSAVAGTPGVNIPASKHMDGVGFGLNYSANLWSYVDTLSRGFSANYLFLGKVGTTSFPNGNAFLASDAYYIDSKIDDGTPDYGKVLAAETAAAAGCVTGSAPNIIYDVTKVTVSCLIAVNVENK